jgi:biotin operon repressor
MTQRDRDRLVVLKQAHEQQITQKQAAEQLQCSERHLRRLLKKLKSEGDKAVIHGLRGRASNRKRSQKERDKIVRILSQEVYHGFGSTLAAEYLAQQHKIKIGREALRKLMIGAALWQGRKRKVEQVHLWRQRRSSRGELVQWDTSEHDWLEGRGEKFYLIHRIDDATSELTARFVAHDSTQENMRLLKTYLETNGRPLAFYTDKASLFQTAPKIARDQQELTRDERQPLPPTQIGSVARARNRVAAGAFPASQRPGRAQLSDRARSAGEGTARSPDQNAGPGQSLSADRVSALVESPSQGGRQQLHRCPSAPGGRARSGRLAQPGGNSADHPRLHHPFRFQALPDCALRHSHRLALAVHGHKERAPLHVVRQIRRNTERGVDGRVPILDRHSIPGDAARPLRRRCPVRRPPWHGANRRIYPLG